ncbi:MAG: GTPase Era [Clostridia bacterium]|nr:GTPase Era [Clostridia bacterium]
MKSGTVGVIGRANAGKSTLINVLVGEKVAIVSPKPQTTRDRILGVKNGDGYQMVFVDTPGLYRAKNLLNAVMQKTAEDAAKDVDVILFVIDAHEGLSDADKQLAEKFSALGKPFALVLSKTDVMPETLLIDEMKEFKNAKFPIVPVSARRGKNINELIKVVVSLLPEGERLFGDDVISDKSEKFMIAEIMREKILLKTDKEIPHGVTVIVNTFKRTDGGVYEINLDIICEKPNHKAIIIGKGGKKIKEISTYARQDMEKFLDAKVFLTTYVKVEEDWRSQASLIKRFGFNEEG